MRDEVFDIEFDMQVVFGSRVDAFRVRSTPVEGQRLVSGVLTLPAPPEINLPHNWKTQIMVALGGDVNVIPEVFALRWGLAYETDGIESGYERLDFMPWQRMAGSFGMTLRISRFELSLGYMHLHWFTRTNTNEQAQVTSPVAVGVGTIINAGRYTASANLVSLGLSYRFR
jgi:long-subunit fatty acid transport protein